jgi:hypothetical protein
MMLFPMVVSLNGIPPSMVCSPLYTLQHQSCKLTKLLIKYVTKMVSFSVFNPLMHRQCYVSSIFFLFTNLALHFTPSLTHVFHLHHLRMILLHVLPLCFISIMCLTCVSPRHEAMPLYVFKDP